ncbi:uncharacterized protein Dwil_GK24222 [Drosophila willistoni]|uniref:Uncharacterized protein n=1 Tax=Drosophila willistoni TaxID=7260 RepID=B4N167_DROWI|nr:uncharacterized protein LOC6643987 [Drosophila willistoni]EDW78049.2 uncharacterized protein Dwil_GK24222 [Drosophila willistoni]
MKDNDIVNLGGNISISSMWEVEPTDRAEVHIAAYHWEVADWQPTIYNMIIPDLCQAVQDPKNYWYIYFGQYIINKDELKEKCFNVIGTKYYLEAYDVRFNISSNGLPFNGRYKVEFKIDVYGNDYTKRAISACFMATGHFLKK